MILLKTEEIEDREYHEVTNEVSRNSLKMERTFRRDVYYPKHYDIDGKMTKVVANDEISNTLLECNSRITEENRELKAIIRSLDLISKEELDRKNGIILGNTEYINRENVEKKRIELAKKELKVLEETDPEALSVMKKTYLDNKSMGGEMKKYDTWLDCWLHYYTK